MTRTATISSQRLSWGTWWPTSARNSPMRRLTVRSTTKVCAIANSEFLTAILHCGLWNDYFFIFFITFIYFQYSIWTYISLFYWDFYFPFLFGLLFPSTFWTFISLFYLDFYFSSLILTCFLTRFLARFNSIAVTFWIFF